MLLEIVDTEEVRARNPAGFSVHAVEHYGLLVANDFVRIVDEPTLVGPMCSHHAYRKAQRFSFVPVSSSDENPAKPVELWNIHCPASANWPYGPLARQEVPAFCQKHGGERVIWGGDLNQTFVSLEKFKAKKIPGKCTILVMLSMEIQCSHVVCLWISCIFALAEAKKLECKECM